LGGEPYRFTAEFFYGEIGKQLYGTDLEGARGAEIGGKHKGSRFLGEGDGRGGGQVYGSVHESRALHAGRSVKKVHIGVFPLTPQKFVKEGGADQKRDSTDIESHEKKVNF
jgi:hypothetical protein